MNGLPNNPSFPNRNETHNCHYRVIDGITVHINGDSNMSKETEEAINNMVRLARNYIGMKNLEKEHTLITLGFDDPYKQ